MRPGVDLACFSGIQVMGGIMNITIIIKTWSGIISHNSHSPKTGSRSRSNQCDVVS